jgi:hypothetical protein
MTLDRSASTKGSLGDEGENLCLVPGASRVDWADESIFSAVR